MALRVHLRNQWTVEFTGLDMEHSRKSEWRAAATKVGRLLQELVAESFASERVAGTSVLKANTPEWNAYKARKGLDSRRGHATNNLQRALDGRVLFKVSAVTAGRVRVTFQEQWLRNWVPYAEFYAQKKIRGRKLILRLTRKWARESMGPMLMQEAEGQMRAARSRARLLPIAGRNPMRVPVNPSLAAAAKFREAAKKLGVGAKMISLNARRLG